MRDLLRSSEYLSEEWGVFNRIFTICRHDGHLGKKKRETKNIFLVALFYAIS